MKKHILIALSLLSCPIVSYAQDLPPTAQIGFSPDDNDSARRLVISVIDSAKTKIRLMGYSFTARDITSALINAKKRGVDVMVVLDEKQNAHNMKQIMRLVQAGIPTRLDGYFPIQHDKAIVIDDVSTETGSFNFTESAERYNSENAVVIWNLAGIAREMSEHWLSRWKLGHDVK